MKFFVSCDVICSQIWSIEAASFEAVVAAIGLGISSDHGFVFEAIDVEESEPTEIFLDKTNNQRLGVVANFDRAFDPGEARALDRRFGFGGAAV